MVGLFNQLFPCMFTAIFLIVISTKQKPPVSHDTGGYFWVLNRSGRGAGALRINGPSKISEPSREAPYILLEPQHPSGTKLTLKRKCTTQLLTALFHTTQKIFVNARVRIGNHRRVAGLFVKCNRADAANDSVTVAVLPHGGQAAQ